MSPPPEAHGKRGRIILFGSGEMSPTGRKIHELMFRRMGITTGIRIGILETPTGFEVNAIHAWPERMENFFRVSLGNFHPVITRIRALRKGGPQSTDDPAIVDSILSTDYLYCGAGAPGYVVRNLKDSLALAHMRRVLETGTTVCLGSASAMAIGTHVLPVYEIFKAGEDLHWIDGLDVLGAYGLSPVIIPHWNNQEGEDFDTTRCYMGVDRFGELMHLLPEGQAIVGIDEQTACSIELETGKIEVHGVGSVHVVRNGSETRIDKGKTYPLSILQ